jgi:hypothetical protein
MSASGQTFLEAVLLLLARKLSVDRRSPDVIATRPMGAGRALLKWTVNMEPTGLNAFFVQCDTPAGREVLSEV